MIDEEFTQGYTGDCWFLAALNSMCVDKEILEKINNMITINKDGDIIKSITVNIQGKGYTIDYKNLRDANEYAWGDIDVRALEIAVNKYMHENNIGEGDITLGATKNDLAYKILFGEDNVEVNNYAEKNEYGYAEFDAEKYINTLKENKNDEVFSNIGSIYFDKKEGKCCYVTDENNEQVKLIPAHAYKYSRIDNEFYYFRNPHAPEKELHIPIADIAKTFNNAVIVKFKKNKAMASL